MKKLNLFFNVLLAYAASNAKFRDSFSEPRLGVLSSAKARENEDDIDIILTFPIHRLELMM